jgi:hypothetical protein
MALARVVGQQGVGAQWRRYPLERLTYGYFGSRGKILVCASSLELICHYDTFVSASYRMHPLDESNKMQRMQMSRKEAWSIGEQVAGADDAPTQIGLTLY